MSRLQELVEIVARLRAPGGCPWDGAQDLATMRPYLLEEAYEVLEAMDRVAAEGDPAGPALREELGDLLFVVLLVARICQERGWFTLDDAASAIGTKMVARHPHVFGDATEASPGTIAAWEARKATRRTADGRPRSRLAGVPATLPGLLRTHRQGEKAASVGFDWPDHRQVLAKVHEELAELEEALAAHPPAPGDRVDATGVAAAHPAVEHELGDLLMALASLGRHVGAPPEAALRRANDRFQTRFEQVERMAHDDGHALTELDEATLDALWERAKAQLGEQPEDGSATRSRTAAGGGDQQAGRTASGPPRENSDAEERLDTGTNCDEASPAPKARSRRGGQPEDGSATRSRTAADKKNQQGSPPRRTR